jgi:hypothetical protein
MDEPKNSKPLVIWNGVIASGVYNVVPGMVVVELCLCGF